MEAQPVLPCSAWEAHAWCGAVQATRGLNHRFAAGVNEGLTG
jgi:hypothetical protein